MTCEALEVTGLMRAFDFDAFFGDRVAVLGWNEQIALPAPARGRRH